MPTSKIQVKLDGKVTLDSTYRNTISSDFISYINNALQGLVPPIQSYQIYDSINNVTVQAKVIKINKLLNAFIVVLQGVIQNFQYNTFDLHLQAILSDKTKITVSAFTTTIQTTLHTLLVTWCLIVTLNVVSVFIINADLLYNFLACFFNCSSNRTITLYQTSPVLSTSPTPVLSLVQGLQFLVAYNNYYSNGSCPTIIANIIVTLMGVKVFCISYFFNCTQSPSLLNYFSLLISVTS